MRSGRLRHRIDVEAVTETRDDFGAVVDTWAAVYSSVPASIEPLSGRDFFSAKQVNSEITHRVRLRYLAGITSENRINFGGRIFEIKSPPINYGERNRELQILCVERL